MPSTSAAETIPIRSNDLNSYEYFYGETLRWSFGFDNPNKAAVIFACLLPLVWWGWDATWGIRSARLRIPALVVAAGALLAVGTCLVMTFSRGGLFAGILALGYVWLSWLWRGLKLRGNEDDANAEVGADGAAPSRRAVRMKHGLSALLLTIVLCLAFWSGLADRSASALGEDASVTNRFDLWKAGLQMACENPWGFGSGRSGTEFMQWYQDPERTEGYRTMVNSYLTFLVEQGWLMFGAVIFGLLVLWFFTRPVPESRRWRMQLALRASILAFLVAGIFSTTMEEWRLWIIPVCCLLVLLGMRGDFCRRVALPRALVWGLFGTCVIVLGLWRWRAVQKSSETQGREWLRIVLSWLEMR